MIVPNKMLVFLDQEPLTNRRIKAFELDFLHSEGFSIEFWNLSQFCFGKVDIVGVVDEEFVSKIDSFQQFKFNVARHNLRNTIFIIEGYLAVMKPVINNYLRRKNAITIRYELNTTSFLKNEKSIFKKISYLSSRQKALLPFTILHVIKSKILSKLNKPYSHRISTGDIIPCDININHSDYIQYLESLNEIPILDKPYILFLDQFYPYHPDYQSHKIDVTHNATAFFADINRFFDLLEAKYSIQVVIAAHPKANYKNTEFGQRQIFYGMSNKLVKDSTAVITIDSASISFVIAHRKPLLLITTNDRQNTNALHLNNQYQKRLADTIGSQVINISDIKASEIAIPVQSEEQQLKYIYTYLSSKGIENKYNTEILPSIYNKILSNV